MNWLRYLLNRHVYFTKNTIDNARESLEKLGINSEIPLLAWRFEPMSIKPKVQPPKLLSYTQVFHDEDHNWIKLQKHINLEIIFSTN